jgi:antirestriction protein ArdC
MTSPAQIRAEITSEIVAALEQGLVPWRKPWTIDRASGRHANAVSKNAYSGINPLILELHALRHGLTSRYWANFNQWKQLNFRIKARPAHVKSGQWAARIVFYKPFIKTVQDEDGDETERQFRVMRTYNLFNADQVEGDGIERFQVQRSTDKRPDFQPAEELIQATGAVIEHGGNEACYANPMPADTFPHHTSGDFIRLPLRQQFPNLGAYYETAFHELAHWSEPRQGMPQKDRDYAFCELIAEMSACFLATELSVPQGEPLQNHAAYVQSWLKCMKGDTAFVFKASTQASKTTDYLLSYVRQPELIEAA